MYTAEKVARTQEDLRGKGVKYCIGAYVDIHGVPKGKVVPFDHLATDGGRLGALYRLCARRAWPGTERRRDHLRARSRPHHPASLGAQGRVDAGRQSCSRASPIALNTRVALKTVLEQAASMGFGFNLGIECEVYLLRKNADGTLSVPNPDDKLVKPCYDVRGFLDSFTWLDKVATCMNDLGWDLYSLDHEDGNGQYEFDFHYADALTMCDRFIFFRYMAKHYAKEEGLIATTMPKPFADKTGTGAHFNMSLRDLKSGQNLFACAPGEDKRGLGLTETGYHFIGGILKHGRALCAAFAPTVNSYKRLVRQGGMSYFSWAPVFNSYGSNNRTNSVRVPMGGGRCESRNADGAVNPYLAATLALAAGLEGVRLKLDPGEPNEDNLYMISDAERRDRRIDFLPQTLQEAIAAFAADPLVEKTLGKELRDEFIRYKTAEWEAYHLTVSPWEIERYSHMF